MSRMLFKAARTFVFTLMALCLLGGCKEGQASEQQDQDQQLEAIFNQVAVYTVEVAQSCDDGHGVIPKTHECTDFWIEGSEFVCKGESYPKGELRLAPDDGCYYFEPVVKTGY